MNNWIKILLSLLFLCFIDADAQKPSIDINALKVWPKVENPALNDNGSYALYELKNMRENETALIVKSINSNWSKSFLTASQPAFINNNYLAFKTGIDSICLLRLGTDELFYISNVQSHDLLINKKGHVWLIYRERSESKRVVVKNLFNDSEIEFFNIDNYYLCTASNTLILQTKLNQVAGTEYSLRWFNIEEGKDLKFWEGAKPLNVTFNIDGSKVTFITEKSEKLTSSLVYYDHNLDSVAVLVTNKTMGMEGFELERNYRPSFSNKGDRIFFAIRKEKAKLEPSLVQIWDYNDMRLVSDQSNAKEYFISETSIGDERVIRLETENEGVYPNLVNYSKDHVLVSNYLKGDFNEWKWNSESRPYVSLISLKDGSRSLLKKQILHWVEKYEISPGGRYVVYYDCTIDDFISLDIVTGHSLNITSKIPFKLYDEAFDKPDKSLPVGIAGWFSEDNSLLVYDTYDIWHVSTSGEQEPICLTNGFGRKNNIKFRLVDYKGLSLYKNNEKVILTAFNSTNKENGFYSISVSQVCDPKLLTMGSFNYYHVDSQSPKNSFIAGSFLPIKAKSANVWIVRRMSSKESPNYFVTRDFKKYRPLSNVNPEKDYNWINSKLIYWQTSDGLQNEGIVYYPENFDSTKKYPVLIYLYEKLSDKLNDYLTPRLSDGSINIPYYVSNGYIVCTPNILYHSNKTGENITNSIVPLAQTLSRLPYIGKIGIQGHSFGGYEVNYLITHSNLFAAAVTAAGASNLVSYYNNLFGDKAAHFYFEIGQGRLGATLWERPDLFIKYSPIFNADQVTTPLLIMHNENDTQVPFEQGLEFFTALRRLKKKVWMLQYNGGGHGVYGTQSYDFTIRTKQFFDYYLKDSLPPYWFNKNSY